MTTQSKLLILERSGNTLSFNKDESGAGSYVLEGCFGDFKNPNTAGLLFNPDVKLLGVKYTGNLDNLEIVDNINDITPNDVFDSIKLKS